MGLGHSLPCSNSSCWAKLDVDNWFDSTREDLALLWALENCENITEMKGI